MNRRLRRWAALTLSLVLALSLLPTAAAEGTDKVTLNGNTYTVSLGMASKEWDAGNQTEVTKYRPRSMERGIISNNEQTQWDYYVLLYNFEQDMEASQGEYQQFWSTYNVEVSIENQEAPPISLTELTTAADGYRKYATVTVTGPWSGSIDVTFTPIQGDTGSGTGGRTSGWVSIRQAQKLTLDGSGNATFTVSSPGPNETYYFYVDLGTPQAATVTGSIASPISRGSLYLMRGVITYLLWDKWDNELNTRPADTQEQQLLFSVRTYSNSSESQFPTEISGSIHVEVEQPRLLFRYMDSDDGNSWYESGSPLRDLSELGMAWGSGSYVRLYYGTTAASQPVTSLTVTGSSLSAEPMMAQDGKIFWALQGTGYGASTLHWSTGSGGGDYTLSVDLPQYGFYSTQVRDSSHYLERIVYSENQTVWLMKEEGFTAAEVEKVTVAARSGNQETPVTITSEQRAGTTDRYDIQVAVPEVGMYDYLFLEVTESGRIVTGCQVSLTRPGNSLFWENYAVGFAFQMGDVLDFNDSDMLMGQTRPPEGDGSYVPFHDVMVAVGEKKTDAAGGIYYEVAENMSVTVKRMRIEPISGPTDTLSFSQSEPVTEITNPATTVPVYSRNNQPCAAVIKAEVAVYDRSGGLITSGTVSIRAAQEVQTVQNVVRPADDTTGALNQALAELAQTLDRDAVCTIQLGKEYHGTIHIPQEFEYARITITGETNRTRIYGGIDLCGGRVDVIREISFFHSDNAADATTSALWGGWCGNVIQCVFSGYPVAADATTGFLAFTNGNVFVDNQIGVKVDLSGTQQGGNNSPWQYNTFLRNGTAVQVLGFNSIMSPYYFRIVDSNFIGNSTDFELQAPGTVYLYRNYFGKIHPQAENRELLDFLTALLSADDKSLHQIVTSNAPRIETGSGSRVVTNPRWKNPEANWWRRRASLEEIFGSGNGGGTSQRPSYRNYLTSDWDRATEIVNEEADQLVMAAAAFAEADGKKEVDVVDQNGNSLGSWTFD